MKSKLSKILLILVTLSILLPTLVFANNGGSERVILEADEIVEGDYLKAAEAIDLSGTVSGDAMVFAGQIDFFGNVEGDLIAAGGNLELNGNIDQNLRAAGGNITINSTVGRNFTVVGGNINLGEESEIIGSTYIAAGNITTRGKHGGNVLLAGGSVIINGVIEGDVEIYAESVVVREEARITGNFVYHSARDAQISDTAVIEGEIRRLAVTSKPSFGPNFGAQARILYLVWSVLASLLFALLAWKLFPVGTRQLLSEAEQRFWPKLGWGFVSLIVIPIGAVIALITIIGIPIGLSALALYCIGIYAAMVFGAIMFAKWLLGLIKYTESPDRFPWLSLILGIIVVSVINPVPFIGFLVCFIVAMWGFGSIILQLKK